MGAYDGRNLYFAPFSGRGSYRQCILKPDLAAPGVDILAASPGGGQTVKSGTSMAVPFVTGASALLMEWGIIRENDVFLYGEKIKSYLQKGLSIFHLYRIIPIMRLDGVDFVLEIVFQKNEK